MRRILASAALAAATLFPASAGATSAHNAAKPFTVEVMAVGLHGRVLVPATKVQPHARFAEIGGQRYAIAPHSPLAALEALSKTSAGRRLRLRLKEDSFGVLVTGLAGENNPALPDPNGWLFKVNDMEAVAGAAVTVLHRGDRVLFYFSEYMGEYESQPSLDFGAVPTRVKAGETISSTVSAFASTDKSTPLVGAKVTLGGSMVMSTAGGKFKLRAPMRPGIYRLRATFSGDVPAFERVIRVTHG